MDPLQPIDVRVSREIDRVMAPVRLTRVERDEARERREQERKRRRKALPEPPEPPVDGGGHVDLRA